MGFFFPLHNHRRPSVLTLEWRSVLLDGCCLLLRLLWTASLHPQLGALHPCGPSGMVRSRRTCHCHSGGDGSRSVSAEGWREAEGGGGREGRLHPLPAIAVRRLRSHTGNTFPVLFPVIIFSPRRREDQCGVFSTKGKMRALLYPAVCLGCVSP